MTNDRPISSPSDLPDSDPRSHRRFVDLLHDLGGVLWEMNAQTWRFTFVSERAERVFGYPISRWYEEPTFWQDVLLHPEDREWCVNYCATASGECRDHAFLYRARAADGEPLWIKDVVRVIADTEGAPAVMRGVMVDVTEEMRTRGPDRSSALDFNSAELTELRAVLAA